AETYGSRDEEEVRAAGAVSVVRTPPAAAVRVEPHELAAQRGARKPLHLDAAPCSRERLARCGADDLGVILIGDDNSAALRPEVGALQAGPVEFRGQAPIEPVAEVEIIRPLAIPEQVGTCGLDLDDDHLTARIDPHQVGPPPVAERHLGQSPAVVTREGAADAASQRWRTAFSRWNGRSRSKGFAHVPCLEQRRNTVKFDEARRTRAAAPVVRAPPREPC